MALEVQIQQDFSGGMYQSPARELIPANGCAKIVNGLLEVDGSVVRRGGSVLKLTSPGTVGDLSFLWDGYLSAGPRTVVGGGGRLGAIDAADTTVVPVDDLSGISSLRPAVGNDMLVVRRNNGDLQFYAGSRKDTYGAGDITTTTSSATVTGVGTAWLANVDAGTHVIAAGVGIGAPPIYIGMVKSVESNTSLTLLANARAAVTNRIYAMRPTYTVAQTGGLVTSLATISNPARLVTASGSKVAFTSAGDFFTRDPTDYHQLPQGAQVLGMESLRNVLFVFSTQGVFTISGMDYDLTDAAGNVQQRLEQINRDIILWDQRGIAGWSGALVVPGVDDVYLLTESAAPRALSEPIRTLYRGYVAAGYQCGGATVYRNHYFLPIIEAGTEWVDTLVCRLDGGGWTQWSGDGGKSSWFATRGTTASSRSPKLFSIYKPRFNDLSGCFTPAAANKNDGDGSTHSFEVVTRDYTTGGLRANLVKKVRLGYELTDAATDNPTITAQYATGNTATYTTLPGTATVSDGQAAAPFQVGTARPRFIRFRFSSVAPAAKMQVKSVEVLVRPGGRQ